MCRQSKMFFFLVFLFFSHFGIELIETRYTLFIIEILEVDEMVSMLPPTQKFQELPMAIGKVVYETRLCLRFMILLFILTNNFKRCRFDSLSIHQFKLTDIEPVHEN